MSTLRIRVYNVLFGDAILLTVPDEDERGRAVERRVLIDVGNALAGAAGDDTVLGTVLENIQEELNGSPLDLYIMTHEHMDHIQGLLYGADKLGIRIKARRVWMTASSEPDYYERHLDAKKKRSIAKSLVDDASAFIAKGTASSPHMAMLLALNDWRSSSKCVDFIRNINRRATHYVHREIDIDGKHPFRKASIRVLAPEEDTSVYYGRFRPHTIGAWAGDSTHAFAAAAAAPPAGVAAGDFFDLVKFRSSGMWANLLQIDKAANNSSIVFELEWNGIVLLFPGDAEEKSWAIMDSLELLRDADFLKVSHHGSANGTPQVVLKTVVPRRSAKKRLVAISTKEGAYSGVPDDDTLADLKRVATVYDTRTLEPGEWHEITFEAAE